jgi:hypothetical protein
MLTRRGLCVLVSVLGSGAFTGCLGDASGARSTTSSPATLSSEETAADTVTTAPPPCSVELDRPTAEYGPSYPTLSQVDSPALAMDFALEFEAAFQRNSVKLLEPDATYDRVVSTDTTGVESVERGYLVGVHVEVEYGREVHTSSDPDAESFRRRRSVTASYFVGDRALRVSTGRLRVVDPRTSEDGDIVACEA